MTLVRRFLAAAQFLTVAPIRAGFDLPDLGRSVPYFPAVGLLIGALLAALDRYFAGLMFPPLVAAVVTVIAMAAVSGGLHLDGAADTADGFFSSRPRERILEIMRDSRIGTMGALALISLLALKVSALASLPYHERWRALLLAPLAGRCMLVAAMARAPYARSDGGLASVYLEHRRPWYLPYAAGLMALAGFVLFGWKGIACAGACVAVTAVFNAYACRKIGGVTGDTLGAVCELVETTTLLAALEIL